MKNSQTSPDQATEEQNKAMLQLAQSQKDNKSDLLEKLLLNNQDEQKPNPKRATVKILTIDEAIQASQSKTCWFQMIVFTIISIPIMMSVTILYSIHYLQLEPKYLCKYNSSTFVPCNRQEFCSIYPSNDAIIDMNNPYTLKNWIVDLNLSCSPGWQIALLGVSLYTGYFVGSLFVGPYADIYGRRIVFLITSVLFFVSNSLMLIFVNIYAFSFLLFIYGLTGSGRMIVGHIYATEFFGGQSKGQQVMTTVIKIMCAATPIFTTLLFLYISKDWVVLYIITIIVTFIALILSFFVPESPKYLVNSGQYQEAKAVISKMSYFNNKQILEFQLPQELELIDADGGKKAPPRALGLGQKFSSLMTQADKRIKNKFFIMCAMWFLSYFGFIFMKIQIKNINGDVFQNTFFAAGADVSGTLLIGVVNLFLGIRNAFLISFMISVCFGILLLIFQGMAGENMISVLVFFSNFGVSAAYLICLIGAVTLFPSKIKATSYSLGNMMSRFAGIFAPMFVEMQSPIPMISFVASSGLAAFIVIFLDTSIPTD